MKKRRVETMTDGMEKSKSFGPAELPHNAGGSEICPNVVVETFARVAHTRKNR